MAMSPFTRKQQSQFQVKQSITESSHIVVHFLQLKDLWNWKYHWEQTDVSLQYNATELSYRPSYRKFRSALAHLGGADAAVLCTKNLLKVPARQLSWTRLESVLSALQVERSNQSATVPHIQPTAYICQITLTFTLDQIPSQILTRR